MIFNNRVWLAWNQQSSIHLLYLTLEAGRIDLKKYFGFSWPLTILLYEKDQVYWMNRWEELRALGFKMLDCLLLPSYQRFFFDEAFPAKSAEVEAAVQSLADLDLKALSNEDLLNEYRRFAQVYKSWYALGWYAEPVQFCAEDIMEDELKYLRDTDRIDARTLADAKLPLFSSMQTTYSAEIEDSLFTCASKLLIALERAKFSVASTEGFTNAPNGITVINKRDSSNLRPAEFHEKYFMTMPEFEDARSAILKHCDLYFWKLNNYHSTQVVGPGAVVYECLKLGLRSTAPELAERVGESKRRIEMSRPLRNKVYQKLRPYYRAIVDVLARSAQMKDARKRVISLANHSIDAFLGEVARRTNGTIEQVRCLLPDELPEFLRNADSLQEEIQFRSETAVMYWGEQDTAPVAFTSNAVLRDPRGFTPDVSPSVWHMDQPIITSGDTARAFITALNDKFMFMLDWGMGKELDSISGECAYSKPGEDEIRGVVRVVRDPKAAADFKEGEILVAPSTTPDYVPLIRRASCIVTDWGGWTSHAALCAREMDIPCIIGTYHASHVLSSGEEVIIRVREGVVVRRQNGRHQ
ncbi:MAG TPA: PEP-utilizing enzyme [Pyrinomonadaceae bacterium]|nr:PEP-utilizing enzyme [Pyrinomonadaceae bacterium]